MQEKQSMVADRLAVSIEDHYQNFGAWPVVWALMRAIRRQRRASNSLSHLSNRMLADMGLPERREYPGMGRPQFWTFKP